MAAVRVLPLVASFVTGLLLGRLTGRPVGLAAAALWLGGLLLASTIVLVAADKVARRFLPLAALLRLTMLVPDRTPSRFTIAMRSGSARKIVLRHQDDLADAAGHVLSLVARLNAHDRRTRGHSERVRAYTDLLAEEMGVSPRDRDLLRWGALLHDIGKLHVRTSTLNKAGKPDDHEWKELQGHPAAGSKLLGPLHQWLGPWSKAVVQHHERWDGTGYPGGIAGLQISLAGRIVAVADAFETMTATRSYKKPMPAEVAREELVRCAGHHFDPIVVRAFLRISLSRLKWVMGPLSWVAQLPFLQGVQEVGARAASAGSHATTAVATATATVAAVGGAVVAGGGVPQGLHDLRPATPTTIQQVDVRGDGLIEVFLLQRDGVVVPEPESPPVTHGPPAPEDP
jgi:putative nucleotidyltransferase with HDIG domain